MNRRQKITRWMFRKTMWWDDNVPGKYLPDRDWAYAPEWGVIGRMCRLLNAHVVVNDQCGIPAHRYCVHCSTAQPDAPVYEGPWR